MNENIYSTFDKNLYRSETPKVVGDTLGLNEIVGSDTSKKLVQPDDVDLGQQGQLNPDGSATFENITTGGQTIAVKPGTDTIQSAINKVYSNGGGTVFLRNGTYRCTTDITMYSNVYLQGESRDLTILDFLDNTHSLLMKGSNPYTTGTISVQQIRPGAEKIKVLVVGGGGGGSSGRYSGGDWAGAGGGGGKVTYDANHVVSSQSYSVTIGQGGTGGVYSYPSGGAGQNGTSSTFNTITAAGGSGAVPNTGGGTSGSGYSGGANNSFMGGGGGGDSAVGQNAPGGGVGGAGGAGTSSSISGSAISYGGGGGGGNGGSGTDGGGTGSSTTANGGNGVANRGGGGGGSSTSSSSNGGDGGSGIVIISYATDGSDGVLPTSTGGTITTSGGQTIHTFTSNGTFTPVLINAAVVIGSGTTFTNSMIGQDILLQGAWYPITGYVSATSILIGVPYVGATLSSVTYTIATTISDARINDIYITNALYGIDIQYAKDCYYINPVVSASVIGCRIQTTANNHFENLRTIACVSGCEMTSVSLTAFNEYGGIYNTNNALTLTNCLNIDITATYLTGNGIDGMNITSCEDISIHGIIKSNIGQGIELVSGNNNITINNSAIEDNGSDGIKFTATSDNCFIQSCSFARNGGWGLLIASGCDTNSIVGNNFVSNTSGTISNTGTGNIGRGNVTVTDFG